MTDAALAELFLQAQAIEHRLRQEQGQNMDERAEVQDALRHATVTRLSLGRWITARQVKTVGTT